MSKVFCPMFCKDLEGNPLATSKMKCKRFNAELTIKVDRESGIENQ